MTTWYIAGPMTGIEDFNYPAFHAAEAMLRDRFPDDVIINPATEFGGDQTLLREVYLRRAVENVLRADRVYTLDGWKRSTGACLEVMVARRIGVEVWHWSYADVPEGPDQCDYPNEDIRAAIKGLR